MSAAKHTETLAWCAGIFEGEGWVCLHRRKPKDRPTPRADVMAGITNTDTALLQPFVDLWGGRLRPRKGTALSVKQVFEWRLEHRKAEAFLRDILPFVRGAKRVAIDAALVQRDAVNLRRVA